MSNEADLHIQHHGHVTHLAMNRPPHNFVDAGFLRRMADALDAADADAHCRAVVLSSAVKSFCAGADFGGARMGGEAFDPQPFYVQAMRLFRTRKPMVAAVQGPAVGAGMGLTLVADFRVCGPAARFSANFNRMGFHPGFGMSVTLPRLVGEQQAALLFYSGRRIDGAEALRIRFVDEMVADDQVLARALALATEMAESAPLAVEATRATLRSGLAERIHAVNQHELAQQQVQFQTADFREGIAAMAERRLPRFQRQ